MKLWLGLCLLFATQVFSQTGVQLAKVYDAEPVDQYLVSEKLDGIRAIWDGERLVTRNGHPIVTPEGYTQGWPKLWLDGELWAGEGKFHLVQQTVLDNTPNTADWQQITYMVFDAPSAEDTFEQRAERYLAVILSLDSPTIRPISQHQVSDAAALYQWLDKVVAKGGEGLMLHRKDALHRSGRSDALLKLKPYMDAEARVIGHIPGKGKYEGKLGSLLVEMPDGKQFRIGTGFTDVERAQPPAIGDHVTYRYQGLTQNGIPRFASFIRVRQD
ncbi:DNA ligase [Rhodanobacter aciditrophus]|uniref:DNA ligase n=1 Tax=Rhodanobacter aciditrophus TaxID=1623218 RepID=A0ABW4B5W3_9GAMM